MTPPKRAKKAAIEKAKKKTGKKDQRTQAEKLAATLAKKAKAKAPSVALVIDKTGGPHADELEDFIDHASVHRPNESDPFGEVSIFQTTGGGVPSFESSAASRVFEYVDRKARSIGSYVPKNRGLPGAARPENMLSVEEKAIILLGRAVGIPQRYIVKRINDLRSDAGLKPTVADPNEICSYFVTQHKDIIAAIQGDMLAAVEEWSPLTAGQHRFVWHARMTEFYRTAILTLTQEPEDAIRRIDARGRVIWLDKTDEIRRLDNAMQTHMKFFEKIGVKDLSTLLSNPSDQIHQQQIRRKEEEIEQQFEEGKISETDRLRKLRDLRHGGVS